MLKRLKVRIAVSAFMLVVAAAVVAPAAHAVNNSCATKGGIVGSSAGSSGYTLFCGNGSTEDWSY